jgi:hypothetical protein
VGHQKCNIPPKMAWLDESASMSRATILYSSAKLTRLVTECCISACFGTSRSSCAIYELCDKLRGVSGGTNSFGHYPANNGNPESAILISLKPRSKIRTSHLPPSNFPNFANKIDRNTRFSSISGHLSVPATRAWPRRSRGCPKCTKRTGLVTEDRLCALAR